MTGSSPEQNVPADSAPARAGAGEQQTASLYERLGGASTVREVIDRFYARVLDDPRLAPFFAGVDMRRLKKHQTWVVTGILGGPPPGEGIDLAAAHRRLHIADSDFDRVGAHLLAVLAEVNAGQETEATVAAALESVRGDIVTADVGPDR